MSLVCTPRRTAFTSLRVPHHEAPQLILLVHDDENVAAPVLTTAREVEALLDPDPVLQGLCDRLELRRAVRPFLRGSHIVDRVPAVGRHAEARVTEVLL